VDDDDETHERRFLELGDLIGICRLTALSTHSIIGLDDVFYRWDGLDRLYEIFDDELIELEVAIVVNRLDRLVSFQAHVEPPIEWPGLVYAVDEETSKVLVEIGCDIGVSGLWRERRLRRVTDVDEARHRFTCVRGGYTPKWLKGKRETTGLGSK
jgi:hypothetical protein